MLRGFRLRPLSMSLLPRLLASSLLITGLAQADEGMWPLAPLDRVPLAAIDKQLGVKLDKAWLARQQAAAVNVGGASGSFVSAQGLVLTNHHVLRSCIDRLSSAQQDLARLGFVATRREDERRCPGLVLKVLRGVDDVSSQVPAEPAARKAAIAALEAPCTQAGQRCQVVALWGGARHHLYRFDEFRDARLVMAPEDAAASFGGDDDNFHYPRFAFDFALLRAYDEQGRPVQPKAWLSPASSPLKLHDPVFTIGHPGRTERLLAIAQLEALRDVVLPTEIALYADEQAVLLRYAARSPEAARQAGAPLASVENRLKALRGEAPALTDASVMQAKRDLEDAVRAKAKDEGPWQRAQEAAQAQRRLYRELAAMRPLPRSLLAHALNLAALHQEGQRPPAEQLEEFRGGKRDSLLSGLRAKEPLYAELEIARLSAFIARAQAQLGAQHPFVAALLAGRRAEDAATHWVRSTRLGDHEQRARWLGSDPAAWQKADDALLRLALRLQTIRRGVQQAYEHEVTQPLAAVAGPLAQARWQLRGDAEYPDATGTLRLSFGRTEEVVAGGLRQPWKTVLGGVYARADAFDQQAPHDLSERLAARRGQLAPLSATPLNFISNNDIIGGNSGSPLVNAKGELVGLAFDGNADSLPGRFHYDGRANRTVAVHIDAILLALEQVYDAAPLAAEMKGKQP